MTQSTSVHAPDLVAKYYTRLFEDKDFSAIPIEFSIDVLAKYREQGHTMIRTRSAGRVEGNGWRIDFGDRKSTRLNSSYKTESRMPSSA